ncbi:hypothetical protein Ppa06_48440 [Planomonospora parontospora subsp. parontospora]|uniref:Sensor-like histidine kinase SenX3 n=3 Tax=Planomonospora parontospora TaxID=58119 RepID=A0AA37BKA1_9ACTN|nr:hypothetical protein GCM10010126_46160 [Planomonospora parontospora]GII11046.1 hypothetical protein Ppa06_48440 [Planomonospora parontospora subsp. parontospora]
MDEPLIPPMRLDDLLAELQDRLKTVLAARDRVHALLEAVIAVGSDLDLETMLRRIIETAATLVEARYGALGVIGPGGTLERFIPVGMSAEDIARVDHWPHGEGLLGLLIRKPQRLRLADLAEHADSYGFPEGHPPMRSFLGVPIRVRGEVFGNLYLTEKTGGETFTDEDEAVVVALATAAGVAIENARLYEQTRRREAELQMFAGVVAHDLKAPLTAVRGFTELAHDALADQSGREHPADLLKRALTASARMGHLIDDLLTYATARDATLVPVQVDLTALADQIVEEHRSAIRSTASASEPQVYIGPLPTVEADLSMIRQLLTNLIGNAIKYTPPGHAAHVDITGTRTGDGRVCVEIADRGIGIPPGEHQAIFAGFHRAATGYTGTGLGLAICQRIVERHGGTITATDNPGGGARFTFTLPTADGPS